jgi:Glycosyl hydrolases family 2, sugar binding domain
VIFSKSKDLPAVKSTIPPIAAVKRNGRSVLPERGGPDLNPPAIELFADSGKGAKALAWQPGVYELKTANGQTRQIEVPALPPPLEVSGPWEVRFQPNRGAPEKIAFEALTDWAQHADAGVKYFSGTATYTKTITPPAEWLAGNRRRYLDLGRVAVIAQVKLNGKNLGILWKSPFRVDVTDALRGGENQLEVSVVNLWPNRMIGDEQLPEDSDRNPNGTLKEWPLWLLEGKPSPTSRFTLTSWRLWKKNSPLQESGLLGPVRLIAAEDVPLTK